MLLLRMSSTNVSTFEDLTGIRHSDAKGEMLLHANSLSQAEQPSTGNQDKPYAAIQGQQASSLLLAALQGGQESAHEFSFHGDTRFVCLPPL